MVELIFVDGSEVPRFIAHIFKPAATQYDKHCASPLVIILLLNYSLIVV